MGETLTDQEVEALYGDWPTRWRLLEDDGRMRLSKGDVLLCVPYWLDPAEKLTVVRRESDGFDPQCNVYRSQVERA